MIQSVSLFMFLFSPPVQGEEMDKLKRDIKALELFLQDQDDYELYCSHIEWDQPAIEVYKTQLTTQLSETCLSRIEKKKPKEE
ncbi:hypothetical protein HN997_00290 [archaeon]|nr:hypothetical protein [archaeon]